MVGCVCTCIIYAAECGVGCVCVWALGVSVCGLSVGVFACE